jgi:3-dehydroquinate dehydratase
MVAYFACGQKEYLNALAERAMLRQVAMTDLELRSVY